MTAVRNIHVYKPTYLINKYITVLGGITQGIVLVQLWLVGHMFKPGKILQVAYFDCSVSQFFLSVYFPFQ